MKEFTLRPDPEDPRLSVRLEALDQNGERIETSVVTERPITLYLNDQEIVTLMTIGDHPELLAVGYLLNQNMLRPSDEVEAVQYDEDLISVRTKRKTNYEEKLKKRVQTSGCGQGTVFGDIMDEFRGIELNPRAIVKTSWLYALQKKINTTPSLYLKAGAIHGCVLCKQDKPLVYIEDVGRHNAVDKIAGYMYLNNIKPDDKLFYTTGRLSSEMIVKTVKMRIPVLLSRSGFTAWGVELGRQSGLTMIGRIRGKRFLVLSGEERVEYDLDRVATPKGAAKILHKSSLQDELE